MPVILSRIAFAIGAGSRGQGRPPLEFFYSSLAFGSNYCTNI